ncbi:MAG: hypothetical protein KDK39_18970 [Leptospiraceae bacterium]|nr:hypothetical protein [Leptospiraceae bacterium]
MADESTEAKKNKKINKMSLTELDAAIKKTEEHMHGLTSAYARALVARKAELEARS